MFSSRLWQIIIQVVMLSTIKKRPATPRSAQKTSGRNFNLFYLKQW